ncbi:hypothetical protein MNBD_GAMMA10-893, partial [hydrothermal vent metagenome]
LLALDVGIEKITAVDALIRIVFDMQAKIDPAILIALIQSQPDIYQLKDSQTLMINKQTTESAQRIKILRETLTSLMTQEAA